jgi:hypothetical protein
VTPIGGGGFSSLSLSGSDDAATAVPRRLATESYCSFEQKTPNAPAALPEAQLGRAIPATSEAPAAIAPDSRTDALETSPANTWLATRTPLRAPTELPPVGSVSTLREHPLANPIGLSYSIAYWSSRSASYAEPSLTQGERPAPAIPDLLLSALPSEQIVEAARPLVPRAQCDLFAIIPAAAPAASYILPARLGALAMDYAPFVPRGPRLASANYPALSEGTCPSPAPLPVENEVRPFASPELVSAAAAPRIPLIAALEGPHVFEPAAGSQWMPSLESQPAARTVRPAEAATFHAFAGRSIHLRALSIELAKAGQATEQSAPLAGGLPGPAPIPVEAAPTAPAHSPAAILSVPMRFAAFTIEAVGGSPAEPASLVASPSPVPVEAARIAPAPAPAAIAMQASMFVPALELVPDLQRPTCGSAGFERQTQAAVAPPKHVVNREAALEPVRSSEPHTPPFRPAAVAPAVPNCQALPMANRLVPVKGLPRANPQWINRKLEVARPKFAMRPVLERYETFVDLKAERKRSGVFDISEYPQFRNHKPVIQHASKAIAASLLVGVALWFGAHAANLGRRVVSHDASSELAALENSARTGAGHPGSGRSLTPVAWAKVAIAKRAAAQVTDSFQQGMQAWGAAAKGWAPGWSRNPDGYVRPGQLALLRPTLSYTDYRLEFFGQIEKKGMSWAVRAHDPQNYYAMKFKVVEPGLRPVLAMVHYPVVGGKAGRSVEVPLAVMIHNDTAYHVAVQVRGHRFTASIEGQEVDSWTDDLLASGGVGFFSEAGERARLYWMKVSKNDDWLGRVCAYLSGSSVEDSQQTAWLERPQMPGRTPSHPSPAPSEAVLLAGETGEFLSGRPQRSASRAASQGRTQIWNS